MALSIENSLTINTYDTLRTIRNDAVESILESEFKRWEWLERINSGEASEYYYSHITRAAREVRSYIESIENGWTNKTSTQLNLQYYVSSDGELGELVLQTRHQHGDLVAFYILEIAPTDTDPTNKNIKHSEMIRKSSTYEYQLAHFLYFQHINASDYINGNTNKLLNASLTNFKEEAQLLLKNIKNTGEMASEILSDTSKKLDRESTRSKRRSLIALRRYRKVFLTVREEANNAKVAAGNDLKSAYDTYHAQVDLKSSIVYWSEKVTQHNKSKWIWLGIVVTSVLLTFASPVFYYAAGGASALVEKSSTKTSQPLPPTLSTDSEQKNESASKPEPNNKERLNSLTDDTLHKVAFASGIADLTGAALIVALMSVLLRLSLRQYNTYMFLGHDAEERVTMLKTYLALSNEGKLSSDGDMKLVLEALFRPSQSGSIPDSTPATPIEFVIKAITERK